MNNLEKKIIEEHVKLDFESGYTLDPNEALDFYSDDPDFSGCADEAAEYYIELVNLGPAGFYEEFKDSLHDWDPSFVKEYSFL